MSYYKHEKVLRVPADKYKHYFNLQDDYGHEKEEQWPSLFSYSEVGKFQLAPTEELYIDYALESDYDIYSGDWGKVRALYQEEKEEFKPIFQQIIPDINMDDVRLVDFCWYNATEAKGYYYLESDNFYQIVHLPNK